MKNWLLLLLTFISFTSLTAQKEISYTDIEQLNLEAIADIYINEVIFFDEAAAKNLTPHLEGRFGQIAKTLIAYTSDDESLLQEEFLRKPTYDDLVAWTIIYGVYNNFSDSVTNADIIAQVLDNPPANEIALNSYYECIKGKFSSLMNTNDLSKYNFEMDSLDLTTPEEKSIFFLNIVAACTQRFQVLQLLQNFQEVQAMTHRMPRFNGQSYHVYSDFEYDDFLILVESAYESYNQRYINLYYNALMAHFTSIARTVDRQQGYVFYRESILSQPKYFHYSSSEAILQQIYDSLNE